jgi:hypothetical protein
MITAIELLKPLLLALQENVTARYEYHRRIVGYKTAGEAAQALFGHLNPDHSRFTFDDCKYWYGRCMVERGRGDADMLLQRHGIPHIRNLPSDMYDMFGEYARTSVLFGISPHYAWHNQCDVPASLQTRFLMYHTVSHALFIVKSFKEFEVLLSNAPEWDEVTGDEHFEEKVLEMIENGEDVYVERVIERVVEKDDEL